MRILALTALALATVATPAFAQEAAENTFGGISVTGVVGLDHVRDGVDKDTDILYGGAIGFDVRSNNLVFGAEGEATFSQSKECVGTACVESGRDLYAGGRIGTLVSDNVLLYVKAGYTNARVNGTVGGTTVTTDDLDGVRGGVGAEAVRGHAFVRIEYRYSNYEQDVVRHQGLIGVGIRF